MDSFGKTIRRLREERKLALRTVAAFIDIDKAILSEIERGQRNASREQAVKLATYFEVKEAELLVQWLSDKLMSEVQDEEIALKALQLAEEKAEYKSFIKIDRKDSLTKLKKVLNQFGEIEKAWIYGSFARQDDGPKSDIDVAVQAEKSFSYFDLAEVQFKAELLLNRKIDIGFIASFKPYIYEHVKPDLKLIYEK